MEKELLAIAEDRAPKKPVRALVRPAPSSLAKSGTITARSRNFFGNRFAYAVISQRAHGLSIGINLNPDKFCNFDCVYCEVDRRQLPRDAQVNCEIMSAELGAMLALVQERKIRELPGYQAVPADLLLLKEVVLSG